jgi:hypothetical protein
MQLQSQESTIVAARRAALDTLDINQTQQRDSNQPGQYCLAFLAVQQPSIAAERAAAVNYQEYMNRRTFGTNLIY